MTTERDAYLHLGTTRRELNPLVPRRRITVLLDAALHLKAAYALVNAVIVTAWYVAAGGGFFWPIFPLLSWGIGLFFHGMDVLRRPLSEDRIRRELDRMP